MLKYEAPYELTRGTEGSAGWDLQATEPVTIAPFSSAIISTGVKLELPEGFYAQVSMRSGHGFKRDLFCHIGIIDSDYRGEIKVKVFNFNRDGQIILEGEKFAQFVVLPVPHLECKSDTIDMSTTRGEGGFGSTTAVS